jgi:NAD-dependent SIR2 family protein deacetylase
MYKDRLFDLIRKEDVVIWIGSGASFNAGFPNSQKLIDVLFESLSETERSKISKSQSLLDFTDEFYRMKMRSRQPLIKILNDVFMNFKPISTEFHDKLAAIPHFKTVVTTNYDTLLEDAYKSNGQLLFLPKHIPYIAKDKVNIFKVHGDLTEPDSIIITKTDYNNFFKSNSESDPFWSLIKERLATKTVLFIGYSIEDSNVSVMLDKITEALGDNRKECFFIAPDLPDHRIADLTMRKIYYINTTPECFVAELNQNICDNIFEDFDKGNVSTDTFGKVLFNNNLAPSLKSEKNAFKLDSLSSLNDKIQGKFTFKVKNDNPEFLKELDDFICGNNLDDIEIGTDRLVDFDLTIEGLKLPKKGEFFKLEFRRQPIQNAIIDLRFEDGFEFNDLSVEVFSAPNSVKIVPEFRNASSVIIVDLSTLPEAKFKLNFMHNDLCRNIKEEIEFYRFLKNVGVGNELTVYSNNKKLFTKSFPMLESLDREASSFLDYFQKLQIIEKYYSQRFVNICFREIDSNSYALVEMIARLIKSGYIETVWDEELVIDMEEISDSFVDQLEKFNSTNIPISSIQKVPEIVNIHGCEIQLGFKKTEFIEPYVTNMKEILENQVLQIKIKGKSNKLRVSYLKDL